MPTKKQVFLIDTACSLGFIVYATSAVVIPICLLDMARELNFHLAGGGSMKLVENLLLLIILFISGHAAARFGKTKMVTNGAWVMAAGLMLFSFAHNYWTAMACCMLIGAGSGMLEALINPLIQDIHQKNSGKALNIINSFFPLGVLISSLLVGEALMIGISWRIMFVIVAIGTAIVGFLFHLAKKVQLPPSTVRTSNIFNIVKRPRFWCFGIAMIFAGAAEASFTFWSATYIRLTFNDIPRAGAIATAIFAGSMFLGRIIIGNLANHASLRKIILTSSLSGIIVSIFIPFVSSSSAFYVMLSLAGFCTSCFWPSIQSFAANELPVDSTLIFIFLSCFGIPGFGLAGWIIGLIADEVGLSTAFGIVPLFFTLLTLAIILEQICVFKEYSNSGKKLQT
jgi:fucose permease